MSANIQYFFAGMGFFALTLAGVLLLDVVADAVKERLRKRKEASEA